MCNFLLLFISLEIFTEKRQCWFVRVPYGRVELNLQCVVLLNILSQCELKTL